MEEDKTNIQNNTEPSMQNGVKNRVFTLPNILSLIRLIIAPLILYIYVWLERYVVAAILVVVSGLTDALDGYIARNCNQISDVGKILDPIADKVTQVIMFICLISRYRLMLILTIILVVKELAQAFFIYLAYKKIEKVESSEWFGKLSTIVLYSVCIALMIFPNIPETLANVLMYICLVMIIVSFLGYLRRSICSIALHSKTK